MSTRYGPMFIWGVTFIVFSVLVILLYKFLLKHSKKLEFHWGKAYLGSLYFSDLILLCLLVFIVGIRTNSGSDYYNYLLSFRNVDNWFHSLNQLLTTRFQNGLYVLMYVIKSFTKNEALFFVILAILNYLPIFYLIRKYSNDVLLSFSSWIFLGFFLMSTNILKQSLAMVLVLLAFDCLIEKKYILFVILSFLSVWFHLSTILVIPIIYFSKYLRPSRNLYYSLSFIGMIFLVFFKEFLTFITMILPIRYVKFYIVSFLQNNSNDIKLQLGAVVILILYLLLLYYLTDDKVLNQMNESYSQMLVINLLTLPFLFISPGFYIFNRIAFIGLQFSIFLVPFFNVNKKQILYSGLVISGFLITILNADNNYYNYSTIYNDIPVSIQEFVRR
ncbi:EpsG family protein [Streptococcus parauberis]|uniref:Conserved domain protein n=1 Tax=Streptococcus parauberis NCFD 2020 TaxID=873447 RepID=F1Z115_9STRE|nr:EpsG family protein [Streptococcus parauberis]EGE54201.1 conserved domain protein [Streptococcus parauberis NCFD 2020]